MLAKDEEVNEKSKSIRSIAQWLEAVKVNREEKNRSDGRHGSDPKKEIIVDTNIGCETKCLRHVPCSEMVTDEDAVKGVELLKSSHVPRTLSFSTGTFKLNRLGQDNARNSFVRANIERWPLAEDTVNMGPGSFGLKRPLFRPSSRLGAHPSFWSRVTWSKAGGVLSKRTDRKYTISISALRLRLGKGVIGVDSVHLILLRELVEISVAMTKRRQFCGLESESIEPRSCDPCRALDADVLGARFSAKGLAWKPHDFKHTSDSKSTHHDIRLRYIDITVAKSLLPLEGNAHTWLLINGLPGGQLELFEVNS
ncbi:hypothetical protein EAG_16343 [Camponotus floridanus]|uniref:Uncharacterized protein n=1 Tax=Camponotus floridanus TaxID=104421 RepID=E1ZZV3_CAMFO|nr:hypothetical protein EAG_16343 [Camponotus floridanus]